MMSTSTTQASNHPSDGGGCWLGPKAATISRITRVLGRSRTSMILNEESVSALLPENISIWRHILYGVHVKYIP